MSTDGNSFLESFADATATWLSTVIDNWGWIAPALLLTALLLGFIVLIAWLTEDIPFEPELVGGIGGIFKWSRANWGPHEPRSVYGLNSITRDCDDGPP